MYRRLVPFVLCLFLSLTTILADGPADNQADKVRPVPPPGITVAAADKQFLGDEMKALAPKLDALHQQTNDKRFGVHRSQLLADIEVLYAAVRDAQLYGEFFNVNDVAAAKGLLVLCAERAEHFKKGVAPWTTETGLVVRGYQSKIDGSYQPYGLVIPANYNHLGTDKVRLDIWCHGRGETLSEVNFLSQRRTQVGQISPPNTIVLHLYGRYCNANKLAGEIDLLEALKSVQSQYRIDEDRTTIRGFSMGGAACWQFAVHYTDLFAAAAPGAGFSETPDFLKVFQKEDVKPTAYEKTLWHMYDCPDWCVNLSQLPTVAYSGEEDSQKQAADIMEAAMKAKGMQLTHLIGPKTKHSYHPDSAAEIERRLASIVAKGRNRVPLTIDFVTYTLRYNHMHWVSVEGLGKHWDEGHIRTELNPRLPIISVNAKNITDFTLSFEPGWFAYGPQTPVEIKIQQQVFIVKAASDLSFKAQFHLVGNEWKVGPRTADPESLRKSPGLQGPIDDAFLDSFLFVKGTEKCANEKVEKWVAAESEHAVDHWRKQFRGHARVKTDSEVTDADIANHNLVLWGDPQSNKILARIASKLPIGWDDKVIKVGDKSYPANKHAVIMIYPNPLNPKRYVVLNSGFTFREYDYLNNARQVPKLPDWAIVDLDTPPNPKGPGKVVAADFFDESWKLVVPAK